MQIFLQTLQIFSQIANILRDANRFADIANLSQILCKFSAYLVQISCKYSAYFLPLAISQRVPPPACQPLVVQPPAEPILFGSGKNDSDGPSPRGMPWEHTLALRLTPVLR